MPAPMRQVPRGMPVTKSGILAKIQPVSQPKIDRLKCSFYGVPKTGKTRLACTFPKPLLIIGAEDGTASVAGMDGVDFVLMDKTDDMTALTNEAAKGHWKTIVMDNATKLRDMRIVELFDAMGMAVPERKPFLYADKAWKSVWTQCSQDLRNLLRPLLDMPRLIPVNIVVIAQEAALYQEDSGAAASSDMIKPKVSSALGDKLANWLNADCDYICQTFIRPQLEEQFTVVGGKKISTTVKTGRSEYCLRIGPHETYITGFRQPPDAPPLPDVIVDPTYEKIVEVITAKNE